MTFRQFALPPLLAVALLLPPLAYAQSTDHILGWVEKIEITGWGVEVKAKVDSGALTSSMHATSIERFDRDGEEWVRFIVDVEDERDGEAVEKLYERPLYRNVILRGAGGTDRRPVVLMEVCIGSAVYEEQFSLENRHDMNYPVLLGRRTIQHLGLIDVTRTFVTEARCDEDSPRYTFEGEDD